MKKILLILSLLIVFGSAFSQNLKGYTVTAKDTLRTDKLLQFNSEPELGAFVEYSMQVDTANRTIVLTNDEAEIGMQLGQELWLQIKNGNGSTFANGVFVYITGGSEGKPTVELAHNRDFETVDAVGMITHDVETGTFGFATTYGTVGGLDTSGEIEGARVYADTINGGKNWTTTIPAFPYYEFEMGFIHTVDASEGKIFINPKGQVDDILHNISNANLIEPFDFRVSSDGATVTGTLSSPTGKDSIVVRWSDGFTKIAVPQQISIPQGTDNDSQTSFAYLQKSTDALAISTTYFPLDEEMKPIAKLETWTAAKTVIHGSKGNQNYNDYIASVTTKVGRIQQIGKWQRLQPLKYVPNSGSVGSVDITTTGGKDSVYFALTQGIWSQANEQIFSAYDMATGDHMLVANYPSHADTAINNLADLLIDATGASMAGDYFTFVTYIIQNKTGDSSHVVLNLPLGSYSGLSDALLDPQGFKVKTIPYAIQSYAGFVYEITLRHTNPGGGTWTLIQLKDIKGDYPFGGGSSTGVGGGITALTQASDFPNSYAGFGGYLLTVGGLESATEFVAKDAIPLTDFDSTGFRLTQSQIIGLVDTISDHRTDIDAALALTWQDVIDNGTATVTNSITTGGLTSNEDINILGANRELSFGAGANSYDITRNDADGFLEFEGHQTSFSRFKFITTAGTALTISNAGAVVAPGTVTHLAPTLPTESALLDDIEGGTRDGDFATLAIAGSPITNSYISNVTEASNNITFTGVGSAFNGSISSIAKTDVANSFIVSSAGYMMDLFNSNGAGSGLRIRGNNIALSVNDASAVERFRVEGDGDIFALNLSSGTKTNVVYIDPSTKELFEGAAPSVSFGTTTQVPYMNAGGTDFLYSANMVFNGSVLTLAGELVSPNIQIQNIDDFVGGGNVATINSNRIELDNELMLSKAPFTNPSSFADGMIWYNHTDETVYSRVNEKSVDLTNASGYEKSADPSTITGGYVLWQSDGTGSGDDGDIMIKINDGSTTKTITLVDFSAF